MNKRITSLLLCLVMIVSLLVTAVPVFAAGSVKFTMKSDKAKASPGDTITYTVTMGEVSRFDSLKYKLSIPEGLTFVAGSGKLADNLKETLNCVDTAWTESTKVFYITLCSDGIGYTSTTPTELMTFQCKVDDGATGSLKIEFIIEPNNCYDSDYDNIAFTTETPSITITAAPKPATGITLNKSELTLTAGDSDTLTATVTPEGSTDTVVWSSSKIDVATVDATGKVTAVAPGEAIITAKAGAKTATCTVKVQAAPCTHNSLTPVPAKDSNCTDKGWDAYQKCEQCGKLFDTNGNPIDGIPYRALDAAAHDFNTSEWGYKGPDGHAHTCSRNAEHHDAVQAHTPDHEGGATYDYAVKCSVCNYVIEPQLEAGNIRIEVPFKLDVKKTGEMDPGKETFKFVVERFGAPVEYVLVQDTVETEGEKTYDGKFVFTISANQAGNLSEGFVIRQVKGNAEGWTYDETKFYATPMFADTYTNVAGWRFLKYDENAELDYNNPIEEIGFTNSYNAKKPATPPAPQKTESPKTGDSNMAGLWIALLFVSTASLTGTTLYSRKRRANNR